VCVRVRVCVGLRACARGCDYHRCEGWMLRGVGAFRSRCGPRPRRVLLVRWFVVKRLVGWPVRQTWSIPGKQYVQYAPSQTHTHSRLCAHEHRRSLLDTSAGFLKGKYLIRAATCAIPEQAEQRYPLTHAPDELLHRRTPGSSCRPIEGTPTHIARRRRHCKKIAS